MSAPDPRDVKAAADLEARLVDAARKLKAVRERGREREKGGLGE